MVPHSLRRSPRRAQGSRDAVIGLVTGVPVGGGARHTLGDCLPRHHLPRGVLAHVAPLIERAAEMPPGAIGGFVGEGSDEDMVGDATAIRALLERPPRPFHEAMTQAIGEASTHRAQART